MREIKIAPRYSATCGEAAYTALSFAEALDIARDLSGFGSSAVVREAHPDGKWGEHSVARFVAGKKVFPFK